jgi:inhibitor of KinA sporulation pathway (predicted exonuclease)
MWSKFDPNDYDYFLVVDLEATCSKDSSIPRNEMEIIEIGAIMYNTERHEVADSFDILIQPTRNPILSDFCKELTTITQNALCEAPKFEEAFTEFVNWYKSFHPENNKILFSSWGFYDKHQILKDCEYFGVEYPFSEEHLNIKKYFQNSYGLKRGIGVSDALKLIGMFFEGTPHRGIDDARNITRILETTIKKNLLDRDEKS